MDGHTPDEEQEEDMSPEFDWSEARPSPYPERMRRGYTTTVHHPDGTTTRTFHLPLPETPVALSPDLRPPVSEETINRVVHLLHEQLQLLTQLLPPVEHQPLLEQPREKQSS